MLQPSTIQHQVWEALRGAGHGCSFAFLSLPLPSGTGRTGYMTVPPNNYPFYNEDEKYVPVMQADGGQLSGEPSDGQYATCGCLRAIMSMVR
jgi:hypothetical protein